MNFIAIDFETAHANFPCELGVAEVVNGQIVQTKSWLIKPACFPYMNYWNQRVHGISSAELRNEPTFEELWSEISPFVEDRILVAHNAAFDMRVLRAALAGYDLAIPYSEYFCSVSLSKKVWKQLPGHSLDVVCNYHNIRFQHHRAGADAEACAKIALLAFEEINASDIYSGLGKLGMNLKRLNE
jgi:DNA polymerase-3 subunit epsilon